MNPQGLKCGHINIYHLKNKIPDLTVFLDTKEPYHLFGVSESWLKDDVPDQSIQIPNYIAFRRDQNGISGKTGLVVYIHHSLQSIARRRTDLECDEVECIWIEFSFPNRPSLFVGTIYRHPNSTEDWYDNFHDLYDKVSKRNSSVLLLGDFNIDMLKPHTSWDTAITTLGLNQHVSSLTRPASGTLIDHIYSNKPGAVKQVEVNSLATSDH